MLQIDGIGTSTGGYHLMKVAAAVREAEDAGFIVTVERQPLKPLAMGHAQTVLEVRPVRDLSGMRGVLWTAELEQRRGEREQERRVAAGLVEQRVGTGLVEEPFPPPAEADRLERPFMIAISIPRKVSDAMGPVHTGIRACKELDEAGAPLLNMVTPMGTPRGKVVSFMTEDAVVFEWHGPSKDDILEECFA